MYKNTHPQNEPPYLGEMIKNARKKSGYSQDVIRKGICGKSERSNIENGIIVPDKILFETLLERMG